MGARTLELVRELEPFLFSSPPDPLHTRRPRNTREVRLNCERTANEPQYLFFGSAGLYSPWLPTRGLVCLDASGSPPSPPFYSPVSTHGAQAPQGGSAHSAFNGGHAQKPRQVREGVSKEASRLSGSAPPLPLFNGPRRAAAHRGSRARSPLDCRLSRTVRTVLVPPVYMGT